MTPCCCCPAGRRRCSPGILESGLSFVVTSDGPILILGGDPIGRTRAPASPPGHQTQHQHRECGLENHAAAPVAQSPTCRPTALRRQAKPVHGRQHEHACEDAELEREQLPVRRGPEASDPSRSDEKPAVHEAGCDEHRDQRRTDAGEAVQRPVKNPIQLGRQRAGAKEQKEGRQGSDPGPGRQGARMSATRGSWPVAPLVTLPWPVQAKLAQMAAPRAARRRQILGPGRAMIMSAGASENGRRRRWRSARSYDLTGRARRCRTSGAGALMISPASDACWRPSSQFSTSARSQATHRGVRLNRRGNSPRCSIS